MWRSGNGKTLIAAVVAAVGIATGSPLVHGAEQKPRKPQQVRPAPVDESEELRDSKLPQSMRAERLLARKPNDRAARMQAAKAHLSEGADNREHVNAAQEHALAVIAQRPTDVEALLLAGQTSLLKNDAAAAARYYRSATATDANNATAFLGLGDALTRLGDEAGATAAFGRYRALQGMPPLAPAEAAK